MPQNRDELLRKNLVPSGRVAGLAAISFPVVIGAAIGSSLLTMRIWSKICPKDPIWYSLDGSSLIAAFVFLFSMVAAVCGTALLANFLLNQRDATEWPFKLSAWRGLIRNLFISTVLLVTTIIFVGGKGICISTSGIYYRTFLWSSPTKVSWPNVAARFTGCGPGTDGKTGINVDARLPDGSTKLILGLDIPDSGPVGDDNLSIAAPILRLTHISERNEDASCKIVARRLMYAFQSHNK